MQVIFEDKDERNNSREANPMNTIICAERVSRCMKREFVGRFGIRRSKIWVSREIFVEIKEIIWEKK